MTLLLTAGGTVAVAAGGLLTALALVRLVLLGGSDGDGGADAGDEGTSHSTERVDRIVAAIGLALLGVALIALGLLLG